MATDQLTISVDTIKALGLTDVMKALAAWRESDRIRMGRPVHGVLTDEEEELIRRLDAWVG